MIRNILCNIDGVGIYGVISICIFFGFFIGMLIWAFALKKNYLARMGSLPLDGGEKNYHANFGAPNSPATGLRPPSPPAGEKAGMRGRSANQSA